MSLHNTELERIIIGSVLTRGSVAVDERRLSTLDFYSQHNVQLWSKILELDEDGEEVNPIELHKRCSEAFPNFQLRISDITNYAASVPASVRTADISQIRSLATARRLQKILNGLAARLEDDPNVEGVITEAEDALLNVRKYESLNRGNSKPLYEVMEYEVFPRLDKFVANETVKIPFGFDQLDDAINGGVGLGELVLLGAKPKSGKSFLTLQIATHHAFQEIPALIVSREMLNFENGFRFLAQQTKYSNSIFRPNMWKSTADELKTSARQHFGLPIHLDDRSKTVAEIRREARRLKDSAELKTVFVDYAQLVRSTNKKQNRSDDLEAIYYDLKEMAQDLELAVYVNAQFNRSGIKSDRPTMADFDGSSAAEKAGNLILLWDVEREHDPDRKGRPGKLWIEAGRNVATDEFNITFQGADGLFRFEAF